MTAATDPDPTPIRSRAVVLANAPCGGGRKLRLSLPDWPGSRPGQFLMIGAGAESAVWRSDPLLPRPMAVYRDDALPAGEIELLYKVVGRGTALLAEAETGASVGVVGPLGRGFAVDGVGSGSGQGEGVSLLVGGGTGIASLYELARARAAAGRRTVVILGARSEADLMARDDFAALDVELVCTTEDGSLGVAGLVTQPLAERLAESGAAADVVAVGPTPMMRACAALAAGHGVACHVSLENPMACGFGVCLGCAAPLREGGFALVCRTGPVFDAGEIDWEGLP